ncbi:MAG: type 4b pilus protein PilO2 [Pararobbsia sp.]
MPSIRESAGHPALAAHHERALEAGAGRESGHGDANHPDRPAAFICGLFWQSLSRRHALRAEAVELAGRLNFDAMVLRIDRSFAGAGIREHARRRAARTALARRAGIEGDTRPRGAFYDGHQQPAPNWLGAFQLPDARWAYFAVRDGAFLPQRRLGGHGARTCSSACIAITASAAGMS